MRRGSGGDGDDDKLMCGMACGDLQRLWREEEALVPCVATAMCWRRHDEDGERAESVFSLLRARARGLVMSDCV